MKNGYIITYYRGTQWIDQDLLLGKQDAQDHINVAMEMEECDLITLHCVDNGDVLYTTELFLVEGKWIEFHSNNLTNQHTMNTLS